jgi:hypothetical protein
MSKEVVKPLKEKDLPEPPSGLDPSFKNGKWRLVGYQERGGPDFYYELEDAKSSSCSLNVKLWLYLANGIDPLIILRANARAISKMLITWQKKIGTLPPDIQSAKVLLEQLLGNQAFAAPNKAP